MNHYYFHELINLCRKSSKAGDCKTEHATRDFNSFLYYKVLQAEWSTESFMES